MSEPRSGKATWTPGRALVVVLSVILAGLLLHWQPELGYVEKQAPMGQPVPLGGGQTLAVESIRSGGHLIDGPFAYDTPGIYLVVRVHTVTPGEFRTSGMECMLRQGGNVIRSPFSTMLNTAWSGFEAWQDLVFERPLDGLDGAELACAEISELRTRTVQPVIDLGIDQALAEDLAGQTDGWVSSNRYEAPLK